jgi:hypothetical protein
LSLKQQQASVVQAWESVNQAEEAVRQGRSIMIFTLITIVFVSLSKAHSRLVLKKADMLRQPWPATSFLHVKRLWHEQLGLWPGRNRLELEGAVRAHV